MTPWLSGCPCCITTDTRPLMVRLRINIIRCRVFMGLENPDLIFSGHAHYAPAQKMFQPIIEFFMYQNKNKKILAFAIGTV